MARVTLLLFAAAREAAGTNRDTIDADTVGEVLDDRARRGTATEFATVLAGSRVWLDGEEPAAGDATPVARRRRGRGAAAGQRRLSGRRDAADAG